MEFGKEIDSTYAKMEMVISIQENGIEASTDKDLEKKKREPGMSFASRATTPIA